MAAYLLVNWAAMLVSSSQTICDISSCSISFITSSKRFWSASGRWRAARANRRVRSATACIGLLGCLLSFVFLL
ncbi:hypothetical protein PFISCL1PPCAC_3888, partial [Pristionchus fissidentatus]